MSLVIKKAGELAGDSDTDAVALPLVSEHVYVVIKRSDGTSSDVVIDATRFVKEGTCFKIWDNIK